MRLSILIFVVAFPFAAVSHESVATEPDQRLTPLPAVEHPSENPTSLAKVSLGKKLFFDPRLSRTGDVSCSSCHDPKKAWSDGRQFGVGVDKEQGNRNTPSLFNVAYNKHQFWDGRVSTLEQQALEPLQNPREMDMSLDALVAKLAAIDAYRAEFKNVYGSNVTARNLAMAIAAFERTIIADDLPIDRYARGDVTALTPASIRGMKLFFGDARCHVCHTSSNFSDQKFHNVGIGVSDKTQGRAAISKQTKDLGAFKTPTLREVTHTAPYMHDGSFKSLQEVVEHYNFGGVTDANNPTRDELLQVLYLSEQQVSDLVSFLKQGLSSP
ncbi:MAG: cytochrome c peroxidase [Pirellulaceae bacterium]|jgi:cytochrome c peroxidase